MFGKPKQAPAPGVKNRDPAPVQQLQRLAEVYSAEPPESEVAQDGVTCVSSGMVVVGKVVGDGTIRVFGRVEGELKASTIVVANGAHIIGDVFADDVTIGGRVKGIVHANRVRLESSAVVEGDIFHRSLSIEENARFEGSSRREDHAGDKSPSTYTSRPQAAPPSEAGPRLNGANGAAQPPASLPVPVAVQAASA